MLSVALKFGVGLELGLWLRLWLENELGKEDRGTFKLQRFLN